MADDKKFSWDDEDKKSAPPAGKASSSFSWDEEPAETQGKTATATATAEPPKPKPSAIQRAAEVMTGFQHPIEEFGRELKSIYHNPGQVAGDVSETLGIPRNVWSDPSLENVSQIGGTGIPGMLFGEHGLIRHPLEFGKSVTGANQAAEDVRSGNLTAIPGDIAGGLANLALLKKPVEAGKAAGGEMISNAKQGLADMTRTPTNELKPIVKGLATAGGAVAGHTLGVPGGEIGGLLSGTTLADAALPKRLNLSPEKGFYTPFSEAEQIEKLGGKVSEAEKARMDELGQQGRLQRIEAREKAKLQPIPTDTPTQIATGGPLPSADDFYSHEGEERNAIRSRTEAMEKEKAKLQPIPTDVPTQIPTGAHLPSGEEFYSRKGEEMNAVRKMNEDLDRQRAKTLPDVAPEAAGPPAQIPAGGSRMKMPTLFQKEGQPKVLKFEDVINEATGVKPLRPDVPLKEQLTNQPPAPLEEVDPVKAKYPDPAVRQMVRANGERIYEAAKADPVKVKAIHDLTRVDLRQALVNSGEDMGQTTVSNSKFAGEGSIPREEAFNRLLDKGLSPDKILELAKKTEGTANDRPQVKYKGGINEKGVEASMRSSSPEEQMTGLSNQIADWNKQMRTSGRSAAEKAELQKQIDEYQERLDELRGAHKR